MVSGPGFESERARRLLRGHRASDPEALHQNTVGQLLGEHIRPTAQRSQARSSLDQNYDGAQNSHPEQTMTTCATSPV